MLRLIFLSTIVALAYGRVSRIPPFEGRIVGGETTTIEEYPYQASLGYGGGHDCGATLITPNVVLTAAHCLKNASPSNWYVRAGTSKRGKGGEFIRTIKFCEHPKYKQRYDYDVALVLLSQSFKLNASIQTISPASEGDEIPDGTLGTVTGWGRLSYLGSLPKDLQKVQVPKVSQKSCAESYSEPITSRMTCYGFTEGGKDACHGDSGGPLVVNGKVVGIVSWGYKCAEPNKPGVYVNVADKEIRDHIDNCLEKFANISTNINLL